MIGFVVCVEYADFLEISAPYNLHHFSRLVVVTSTGDTRTIELAGKHGLDLFTTDVFWDNGAAFNKWAALELCFDHYRDIMRNEPDGWVCVLDADVLWPKVIDWSVLQSGCLHTPPRRMFRDLSQPVPAEDRWHEFPYPRDNEEFASYTQIFSIHDPRAAQIPWFETNWMHAGGADTFFARRWTIGLQKRPGFDCLHLGEDGRNWCGRVTPYLDGSTPAEADLRAERLQNFMRLRRRYKGYQKERF